MRVMFVLVVSPLDKIAAHNEVILSPHPLGYFTTT